VPLFPAQERFAGYRYDQHSIMSSIPSTRMSRLARAAVCLAGVMVLLPIARTARACETRPDLHIEVTAKFDATTVRNDYSLGDIAALARQQHRDADRALLGFYASEFGYTIDLVPAGDQTCPTRIETIVTLRLQHRLIEIGREAATNSCVYPVALRHYRRLAEVDEQTVDRFSARAAVVLAQASPALKQTRAPRAGGLDSALHEQIRAIVDGAIALLHSARRDAQQTVSNSDELAQLVSSCSI
jgi:hypothetical protein